MVKVVSSKKNRVNNSVRINGILISFDRDSVAEIEDEDFAIEIVEKYYDLAFLVDDTEATDEPEATDETEDDEEDIDKDESSDDDIGKEEGDDLGGQPNPDQDDIQLSDMTMAQLREVAQSASLPKEEWEGFKGVKGKQEMLEYMSSKMNS